MNNGEYSLNISEIIIDWSNEDLQNLIKILDPENEEVKQFNDDRQKIIHLFRWSYHSVTRAKVKSKISDFWNNISDNNKIEYDQDVDYPTPTYEELLNGACKKTNSYVESTSTKLLELYLVETLMIKAMFSMNPSDRHKTLNETFNPEEISKQTKIKGLHSGPLSALGTLALANASGFGIYLAATTTLGFMTHAIGITLPFAVYTGLTSTIAFIIGPVGWLGAGIWSFWTLTGAEWKKIIPALVYIISVNSRYEN